MEIEIVVKGTVGTREKDKVVKFETITDIMLKDAKVLWEFEQFINSQTKSRIHVNLNEGK